MKTPHTRHLPGKSKTRGSALVTTVILCAAMLILVASYMQSLSVQAKLSSRAMLKNEARNAAEGVAEYALAEIHRRSQADPSFGAGTNPNLLAGFTTLTTANVNFIAPGTGNNHVVSTSLGFKNSALSTKAANPVVIDINDPVNADDLSLNQALLSVRTMNVFATAAVLDPISKQQIASYVSEEVQVRDQTWLNYAIFYNMDLELHAGPDFTIFGPVMSNANVFATAGSGNELDFYSSLTAVGKIYRYDKYTGDMTTAGHTGVVKCITKPGMVATDLVTMSGAPSAQDSTDTNFKADAQARWFGFVKDGTFTGVAPFNPPGMQPYVPENFATTTVTEMRNNAYLMVEPQLGTNPTHLDPYTQINDYGQKVAENIKFSALSGFVIQVLPPNLIGTTADYVDSTTKVYYHHEPQWQLVCYQATDTTQRLSADNPPARDANGLPIIACKINPFTDPDDGDYPTTGTGAVIKRGLKIALLNAIIAIPYSDNGTTGTVWGDGNSNLSSYTQKCPILVPLNVGDTRSGSATSTFNTALNVATYCPIYDQREGHDFNGSSDVWLRMKGAMHVIEIDFAKLNALLNDATGLWQKPYSSAAYVYDPANNFTGVVYVQMPLKVPDAGILARFPTGNAFNGTGAADVFDAAGKPALTNCDRVRPPQGADPSQAAKPPGFAVLLANAGTVPHLPGATAPDGFTVATNGPMYVWGNYNSDGVQSTGSATTPDSASELPAMLAADAITVLSTGFALSDFQAMATTTNTTSSFTEISASIITGLVPTQPGTNQIWAGGVHNLVRLLENWGSTVYRYRGSIAVLFECEVAKGAYHEGHNPFYSPPTREIGYHQYLGQGRFPPACPINRTVRRMNLQDITATATQSPAQIYTAGPGIPPAYN